MRIFFSSFSCGQGKLLILQHIWLYIIISISEEIRPTLRLSSISVYLKFLTFYQITLIEISQHELDLHTNRNDKTFQRIF